MKSGKNLSQTGRAESGRAGETRVAEKQAIRKLGKKALGHETCPRQCIGETAPASRDSIAKTSLFREHLLTGMDSGRERLIRARSGLECLSEKTCIVQRI